MNASLNEKLRNVKWGEHKLGDIFSVLSYKKRFDTNKVCVLETGRYPYIVRMGADNGQKGYLNENIKYLNEGNTISFGQDTATVFYQEKPFFTGDKIKILKPRNTKFCKKNAQFFIAAMNLAFSSFSWGSTSFSIEIIKNVMLSLPTTFDGEVDYDFMNSLIAEVEAERVDALALYLSDSGLSKTGLSKREVDALCLLNSVQWGKYRVGDLFQKIETQSLPYKAKELPSEATPNYTLPCLTSSFKIRD